MRIPFHTFAYIRSYKSLTFPTQQANDGMRCCFTVDVSISEAGHSFMLSEPSVILLWTANFSRFSIHFFICRNALLTFCHLHCRLFLSIYGLLALMLFWISKLIWGDESSCFLTSLLGPTQDYGMNIHSGHLLCPSGKFHIFLHIGLTYSLPWSQGHLPWDPSSHLTPIGFTVYMVYSYFF